MDKSLTDIDWSLLQAFVAVAETGSLSAAARKLGASQPTLGRQIKALESQLEADLFLRQARGLQLTDTGSILLEHALAMREAAQQISLAAAGTSAKLEGTVRITASVMTATYHLPPIIARIRREEPEIAIELVPSDQTSNLLFREADIAVRMYRPTQLDLVTRHIGDLQIGAFVAKSYLAHATVDITPETFLQHDFVGHDLRTSIVDGFQSAGLDISREFFKVRCDDNLAYWHLVLGGCGIGFGQRLVGVPEARVVEIPIDFPIPGLPIWLTTHEAMRKTPRVRRVWDMLAAGLEELMAQDRALLSASA